MEKLSVKSLQIGDYVNYRGQIIKVTSLYDKGGSNEVGWGIKEDTWVNADNIEPIPLIPEILEKNGFVLKEEEVGAYGVNIAPYYTRNDVPFEVFCDGEPFAIWFKDSVNIAFVHELQHALRLCGIEKEIIL